MHTATLSLPLRPPSLSPCSPQEAKQSEEEVKKQQEQAANAYLHLNSYLALPAPGAPDGGMGAAGGYGQPAYGGGFQQF